MIKNNGFITLGSRPSPTSPIVVIGTARGGTSMIAGTLNQCGVYCGDSASPPVYEDLVLSTAFEENDFVQVSIVSDRYSRAHDVWAWKRPSSVNYLRDVHRLLENPSYIFVFRDILSIANRNHLSMNTEILSSMQRALNDYSLILDFSIEFNSNIMQELPNNKCKADAYLELNKPFGGEVMIGLKFSALERGYI